LLIFYILKFPVSYCHSIGSFCIPEKVTSETFYVNIM